MLVVLSCGFVFPKQAAAIPVEVTVDAQATQEQIMNKAVDATMDSWKLATTQALITALDMATQTMAKNYATWLATGGASRSPLAWLKSLGKIAGDSYANAASDFLNTLAVKYTGYGLCQPVDPQITLNIKLGIFRDLQPSKPKCTWNQLSKNYDTMKNTLQTGAFLKNFSVAFQPAQNDIDNALTLHYAARNEAQKTSSLTILDATKAGGFSDLTSLISGDIKTPASMIQENLSIVEKSADDTNKHKFEATIGAVDVMKSAASGIAANAGKMFLNTLSTKLVDKYTKGGMFSLAGAICATRLAGELDVCKKNGDSGVPDTVALGANAVALADAYYTSIFTATPSTNSDYSLLADLIACPDGVARNVYNCAMDQQFANALQKQTTGGYLTVERALLQGIIPNNAIIGKGNPDDGTRECYTKGYCYTNLRKLRRADIVPVGWELAAEAIGTRQGVTLREVMSRFNDCNSSGSIDGTHPYCHLIDPDWVLKIPLERCNALVSGQTLEATGAPDRAQVCTDVSTCISEDTNGKCTGGYGYCTREKGGWSVNADSCPSQYGSCEAYAKTNVADGEVDQNGAWLSNTLDAKACTATTAGCRAFAINKSFGKWVDNKRLYITSSAPVCEASAAGCAALQDAATTSTRNLISNPSFENARADGLAVSWLGLGGAYVASDVVNAFDGKASYHVQGDGLKLGGYNYGQPTDADHYGEVVVQPKSVYTFSFYAKGSGTGTLTMKAFDSPFYGADHACDNGTNTTKPSCLQNMTADVGILPACATTGSGAVSCTIIDNFDFGTAVPKSAFGFNFPLSSGYERYTMTFATSSNTHYLDFLFNGGDFYLDAIQLELAPSATTFHVGGSDLNGTTSNIKIPPAYLKCSGDEKTDPADCKKYAAACRATEAGCDGFTPVLGGTTIPGVVNATDICPAVCVGYSTFKQEATQWEVTATDTVRFPKYFIPSTGKSCSLPDVGCDEFTNLEKVAAGGESKNYFTFLRACRKSDQANESTFFIWEGSDTSGYQLKSFVLRTGPATDTRMSIVSAAGDTSPANGPTYIRTTDASKCSSAIVNLAATDPNYNPDCREFINANGDRYYRLLSRTISSTDECNNFRKTISAEADCVGTGGIWDANSCTYEGLSAESITCQAQVNGCRLYTGNNGANTETILFDDFESGSNGWVGGQISGEATVVGGHSLASSNVPPNGTVDAIAYKPLVGVDGTSILKKGKSYTVTVWAKGKGSFGAGILPNSRNFGGGKIYILNGDYSNTLALTSNWQRYVLGPVFIDSDLSSEAVLNFFFAGKNINDIDYLDNIEITATNGQFAIVKDSWKTPDVCDKTVDGAPLPQAQLGCAAYNNTAGTITNLKSFTSLCRNSAIGCKAFIDRAGTVSPFTGSYNVRCETASSADVLVSTPCVIGTETLCTISANSSFCRFNKDGILPASTPAFKIVSNVGNAAAPDIFAVPADTIRYFVAKEENNCERAAVGCTELGKIEYGKTSTCTLAGGVVCNVKSGCACTGVSDSILQTKTNPAVACFVAKGDTSCTYSVDPNKPSFPASSVYRIVKPDNFAKGDLCNADAVGCDAWTSGAGTTQYFKNPGDVLCEYKSNVIVAGTESSGWFKKNSNEPCDPKFVVTGSTFGIHKNLDEYYANFAGVCITSAAGCTEYRDTFDQSVLGGKSYFFIKNNKITDASANCAKGASNKKGCVLFNDQSNPSAIWNAAATYDASAKNNFDFTPPVSTAGTATPNDANIVLEAQLDRTCSEWLECNSWETVKNSANGQTVSQCLSLGSCIEKDANGNCAKWQDNGVGTLLAETYASRPVVFGSPDFTGYSAPGLGSLGTARQIIASVGADYAGNALSVSGKNFAQSCKSYPEASAPFSQGLAPKGGNVCDLPNGNPTGKTCDCSYRKVSYSGGLNKYFPPTAETSDYPIRGQVLLQPAEIPSAVCVGGAVEKEGKKCNPLAADQENECPDGTCTKISKIESVIGGKGYCLEYDSSIGSGTMVNGVDPGACLTWFPIDQPNGKDILNQFASAAFVPNPGQERYCAAPLKACGADLCDNGSEQYNFCKKIKKTQYSVPPPIGGYKDGGSCANSVNYPSDCGAETPSPWCDNTARKNTKITDAGSKSMCSYMISQACSVAGAQTVCQNNIKKAYPDQCGTDANFDDVYGGDNFHQDCFDMRESCVNSPFLRSTNCQSLIAPGADCDDLKRKDTPEQVITNELIQARIITCAVLIGASVCLPVTPAQCESLGKIYCTNDSECKASVPSASCQAVKEIAVNNTEYTANEFGKGTVNSPDHNAYDYPPNAHSLGWSTEMNSNGNNKAYTVDGVLQFAVSTAPESVSGPWSDYKSNDDSGSKRQPVDFETGHIISGYPADFTGMYYITEKEMGTVNYDLVYPALLLQSQLSHITIAVASKQNELSNICSSDFSWTKFGLAVGAGNGLGVFISPVTIVVGLFAGWFWDSECSHLNLGYTFYSNNDDENFTKNFAVLSTSNGWSATLAGKEGNATFKALFSNTTPVRLTGMRVEFLDNVTKGYFYINGANYHLEDRRDGKDQNKVDSPACGLAGYIGSSNPQAEKNIPTAFTNRLNSIKNYDASVTAFADINDASGKPPTITYNNKNCPWGVFTYPDPASIILDSTINSGTRTQCQFGKGAIFSSWGALKRLYQNIWDWRLFNEDPVGSDPTGVKPGGFAFTQPYNSNGLPIDNSGTSPADSGINGSMPSVSNIKINGSGDPVNAVAPFKADLKFYAGADANHMPLRSIRIDWNDGTVYDSGIYNSFKNHLSNCAANDAAASSFALAPSACDTTPFSFSHVYTCASDSCVFTPIITVGDNWRIGNALYTAVAIAPTITLKKAE